MRQMNFRDQIDYEYYLYKTAKKRKREEELRYNIANWSSFSTLHKALLILEAMSPIIGAIAIILYIELREYHLI